MRIGVLHPGEMGTAIATTFSLGGHEVMWLPDGRSDETHDRAEKAALRASSLEEMAEQCEIVFSVCPPHAAIDVAAIVASSKVPFQGIYIDANAIAPHTSGEVASIITKAGAHFVDGCIIGAPPPSERTRLYLSGEDAQRAVDLLADIPLDVLVIGPSPTAASALKMAYAAWIKGTRALILTVRAMANLSGVEAALIEEWERLDLDLVNFCERASSQAMKKGWRWVGEMEEIAKAFASEDLPEGFGKAAAEVFRRIPRQTPSGSGHDVGGVIKNLTKSAES